jgi:hypothetical protein
VKVLDFGASELSGHVAATTGAVDPRSDLHDLGALLYRVTTGRAPEGAAPPRPTRLNREVPERLSDVIESCLARDPDRRPDDASEVEGQLRELADDLEWNIQTHLIGSVTRAPLEPAPLSRWPLVVAAVLFAVAAIASLWLLLA